MLVLGYQTLNFAVLAEGSLLEPLHGQGLIYFPLIGKKQRSFPTLACLILGIRQALYLIPLWQCYSPGNELGIVSSEVHTCLLIFVI